jgi:hypothetical protein
MGCRVFGVPFCREIQSPFALCSSSHQFPFLPQNNSNKHPTTTLTPTTPTPTTTSFILFCLDHTILLILL